MVEEKLLLYQLTNNSPTHDEYDYYKSCIVCAANMSEARKVAAQLANGSFITWPKNANEVKCQLLGEAAKRVKVGIIMSDWANKL